MAAVLDDGTIEVIGQTVNVSTTGMLVQGATILEPGQRVVFDVTIPDDEEIASKLEAGKEVEYWNIMGTYKIQRVKG